MQITELMTKCVTTCMYLLKNIGITLLWIGQETDSALVMCLFPLSLLEIITNFFGYNTEFFSFLSNPKNLDPSSKMGLDLWDCLGRVKLIL